MNTPYIKNYNEEGVLTNPIFKKKTESGRYLPFFINEYPNRRSRRENPVRFKSNKKGHQLVIGANMKYFKKIQTIVSKDGKITRIQHYSLNK